MISQDYTYAIVGASNNPEKYGYKVLKDLIDGGYNVLPVNLKESEILGLQAYPSLTEIPGTIDVVITIVPPQVTDEIVKEAHHLGIKNVWMQPGSESQTAIEYCEQNGINCTHNACIMVERKKSV